MKFTISSSEGTIIIKSDRSDGIDSNATVVESTNRNYKAGEKVSVDLNYWRMVTNVPKLMGTSKFMFSHN